MVTQTPSEDDGSSPGLCGSNDLNGKALSIADGIIPGPAITHYARKLEDLRNPAPVFLPIKFDRQIHPFIIVRTKEEP
jgi:hypothetical protein